MSALKFLRNTTPFCFSSQIGQIRLKHEKAIFVPRRLPGPCRLQRENPTRFGPLTNLPDYTFMDGRPTPLGSNQKERVFRQREVAQKIVTMIGEIDFAKDRFSRIQKEKDEARKKVLDSKLKEKGLKLLKKK